MEKLRPFLLIIGLSFAYSALFLLRPQTDLEIAQHFYKNGFYLAKEPWIQLSYNSIKWLTRVIATGTVLLLVWYAVKRKPYHPALYILLSLVIGPGLLTHTLLKDHWGRARPSQITEFGGNKHFTPPLIVSDQCDKNCSFVSGHAAMGFFLTAFALLFGGRKRTIIYSLGILFGLWIGFVRMAMGGHFLSDVIFAGLLVMLINHLTYYFIMDRKR